MRNRACLAWYGYGAATLTYSQCVEHPFFKEVVSFGLLRPSVCVARPTTPQPPPSAPRGFWFKPPDLEVVVARDEGSIEELPGEGQVEGGELEAVADGGGRGLPDQLQRQLIVPRDPVLLRDPAELCTEGACYG